MSSITCRVRASKGFMDLTSFHLAVVTIAYLSLLSTAATGVCGDDSTQTRRKLLLISFDGFRWDYLHGRTETPNFNAFKLAGVHAAQGLLNEFVTNTVPNHFTLATGLHVESHGMVDNLIHDPRIESKYEAIFLNKDSVNHPDWHKTLGEPIWVTNQMQKAGRSGVMMWMGGEWAIQGVRPTRFVPHNYDVRDREKVDNLIKWMTDKSEPINLGLVYFPEPDKLAHEVGPDSVEVTRKIAELDGVLGYLMGKLKEHGLLQTTDIILTSDHGFVSVSSDRMIPIDDIIDPSWYRQTSYMPGPIFSIIPGEGKEDIIFQKLQDASRETGLFRVFRKEDIPDRFRYKNHHRVAPIIGLAEPGYTFRFKTAAEDFILAGNHGYDNQLKAMHPFFMAQGPAFRENFEVETFRSVDIYPLMCHILGIQAAPNNGSLKIVSTLLQENYTYALGWNSSDSNVLILGLLMSAALLSGLAWRGGIRTKAKST